ncbi:Transcription factor [Penicillium bovifimosum]|uniref:Transcription factor n=1 Tax=Penicillium bovifimosum TaxID=126998 RepID=A0A9W9H5Q7_9EURO|nr:Transcription factor [Penicillium bovifimosum]KAJ5139175.1 Transcription factor [Penicillium bovifimosum]
MDSSDHQGPSQNPYPYDTSRISELLKRKRRTRGIKSCFPCRHRKVRCDGNTPCSSCVQRHHPELCCLPSSSSGQEPPASEGKGSASMNGDRDNEVHNHSNNPRGDQRAWSSESANYPPGIDLILSRLEKMDKEISSLKAELRQTQSNSGSGTIVQPNPASTSQTPYMRKGSTLAKSPGKHFVEDATGATIFLGSHSDPPVALGCRQAGSGSMLDDTMLLDQLVPRTYPFTNLWKPEPGAGEIYETLPDESDIIRYWQVYQTSVHPFYPALVTYEQFNISLFGFLNKRSSTMLENETSVLDDTDSSWLALLFAVLACGVQFSNDPIKERDLRCKVFICSSFQCLRASNFFNNTNMDQIQAKALIGHCLRNNLDTNSAWILMGSTIRLAQSIGLHEETASDTQSSTSEQFQRRRLWWMLLWQDTFLSFTYDRPPNVNNLSTSIPHDPDACPGLSFAECVCTLCQILLERARQENTETVNEILSFKGRMAAIFETASPFLQDKMNCRSLQEHLERLALSIHICYAICRLCRLVLETAEYAAHSTGVDVDSIRMECIDRAAEAVESFLDMHRLAATVCRSWAFVHNAVSCALTLQGLVATGPQRSHADMLVKRLIAVLEREERQSVWQDTDTNVRYFGPYSRALKALHETSGGH